MSTTTSDTKLFPIELYERVIDLIGLGCREKLHPSHSYSDLLACALVSKQWMIRSRYNLYHTIEVGRWRSYRASNTIFLLSRTIMENPGLSELIAELRISPRTHETNVLYTSAMLPTACARLLRGLHTIELQGINWTHPRRYDKSITTFPLLSQLRLHSIQFHSTTSFMHFVRCLKKLKCLSLEDISLHQTGTTAEYARLSSLYSQDTFPILNDLSLSVCLPCFHGILVMNLTSGNRAVWQTLNTFLQTVHLVSLPTVFSTGAHGEAGTRVCSPC